MLTPVFQVETLGNIMKIKNSMKFFVKVDIWAKKK